MLFQQRCKWKWVWASIFPVLKGHSCVMVRIYDKNDSLKQFLSFFFLTNDYEILCRPDIERNNNFTTEILNQDSKDSLTDAWKDINDLKIHLTFYITKHVNLEMGENYLMRKKILLTFFPMKGNQIFEGKPTLGEFFHKIFSLKCCFPLENFLSISYQSKKIIFSSSCWFPLESPWPRSIENTFPWNNWDLFRRVY